MEALPRITVEMPVLSIGSGTADYEDLGGHVRSLRKREGLHLTLLHIGILADFSRDVAEWTKGRTSAAAAAARTAAWLKALPVLDGFTGGATRLATMGGGGVCALEVDVPQAVRDHQVALVQSLHALLDGLLVDNVDDFILGSPALGFKYPRWTPHIAVGRPMTRHAGPWEVGPLAVDFGASRIRNRRFLPDPD
ncbi:hypothetical protein [Specibacter cremeus]|uniref:hypothetical protein n=1 Tax=Specibacter cremeus TaxID=1629051 RepID=UPI000F7A6714|nr:hypothetical protein [Specibacter cremeus]